MALIAALTIAPAPAQSDERWQPLGSRLAQEGTHRVELDVRSTVPFREIRVRGTHEGCGSFLTLDGPPLLATHLDVTLVDGTHLTRSIVRVGRSVRIDPPRPVRAIAYQYQRDPLPRCMRVRLLFEGQM